MPVLKFHRDKRGYEYFSLVEPSGRKGKPRTRILYWFRTPPHVKLGREPFDDELRRALEAQYPRVRFDWARILATPIPSAEDEMWRERRRAAKAAKQAARTGPNEDATADEAAQGGDEALEPEEGPPAPDTLEAGGASPVDAASSGEAEGDAASPSADGGAPAEAAGVPRRRRRRRRGRRPGTGSGGAT